MTETADRPRLTPGECMALLHEAEIRFPVASWSLAGVPAWPLLRGGIYVQSMEVFESYHRSQSFTGRLRRQVSLPWQALSGAARGRAATLADGSHGRPREADVVFLGDGVSRETRAGISYDRLCDPFIDRLGELGVSSLHLEPCHNYPLRRSGPSWRIQSRLDWLWLQSRLATPPPGDDLARYEELLGWLPPGLAPPFARLDRLRRHLLHVRLVANWFKAALQRAQPKLAFVVDYGHISRAFNLACSELGIRSVEIQHGLAGRLHWAYGRWKAVPAGGFSVLPDLLWAWTVDDADAVNDWGGACHSAVVGGHPAQLNRRRDPDSPAVTSPRSGKPRILITLQPGLNSPERSAVFRALIRSTRDEWDWAVRSHPNMRAEEIRRAFELLDLDGGETARSSIASTLPLDEVLSSTAVHLTHESAVAVEAAWRGVPSVVTSPEALAYFPELAANGAITWASDLAEEIRRRLGTRVGSDTTADGGAVLRRLLESEGVTG